MLAAAHGLLGAPQMKEPIAWPVRAPHIVSRRAGAADLDGFNHVNNLRYIAWALEAAWSHSDALGLPFSAYERLGVGCVVWRHQFDYLAPVRGGEEVLIATWIAANDGRVRLTRAYEMRVAQSGVACFRGETLFVSIDMKSGKPARMPASFVDAYRPAEKAP